jgi:hypothetical protein
VIKKDKVAREHADDGSTEDFREARLVAVSSTNPPRAILLHADLGFLQLPPRAPKLALLHRWLDTWTGLGLIVVGVERQGLRFSLGHIDESELPSRLHGEQPADDDANCMVGRVRAKGGMLAGTRYRLRVSRRNS